MTIPRKCLSLVVASIALLLAACTTTLQAPAISGRVLDQDTNRPLAGAVVLAYWNGDVPIFPESRTYCFEILSAITDAEGNYRLPSWRRTYWESEIHGPQVHFLPYYPGYIWSRTHYGSSDNEATFLMVHDKSSREARFEALSKMFGSTGCGWYYAGSSMKNFVPFGTGIAKELKSLAQSPKELERLQQIRESVAYHAVRSDTNAPYYSEDMRQRVKKYLEEHPE
jgi:hypothetical protein